MSSASSSAISPAATFAEAPAQQPLAFAAVGATTRQSHRFHPYEDPAECVLQLVHTFHLRRTWWLTCVMFDLHS